MKRVFSVILLIIALEFVLPVREYSWVDDSGSYTIEVVTADNFPYVFNSTDYQELVSKTKDLTEQEQIESVKNFVAGHNKSSNTQLSSDRTESAEHERLIDPR